MASQQNIDWLVAQGCPYIVVSRERHREFDVTQAVERTGLEVNVLWAVPKPRSGLTTPFFLRDQ